MSGGLNELDPDPACPLDGILAELAELAGRAAALGLAHARGGTVAYIPTPDHVRDDHWLAAACGLDAARRIAADYAGTTIKVPLGPFSGNRARVRAAIRAGIAAGRSDRDIARSAGVDESTVRRHRARGRAETDPRQGSLF
ncbi:MAG: hypothetical protein K2Q10_13535 [Rhodospirillales bacterium]|nr:hypothetical protein [Rhodospirillales bacterium]